MSEDNLQPDVQNDVDSWAAFSLEDLKVFSILVPKGEQFDFDHSSGMLAYALYVLHKNQFIINSIEQENSLPKNDEIRTVIKTFQYENNYLIDNLKQQSQSILNKVVEERANQIVREKFIEPTELMIDKKLGATEKIIKDCTRFRIAVMASICASIAYSLLIAVVIFTATSAMPDTKFSKAIRILFDVEKIESTK
jgi:hypothetical protein